MYCVTINVLKFNLWLLLNLCLIVPYFVRYFVPYIFFLCPILYWPIFGTYFFYTEKIMWELASTKILKMYEQIFTVINREIHH